MKFSTVMTFVVLALGARSAFASGSEVYFCAQEGEGNIRYELTLNDSSNGELFVATGINAKVLADAILNNNALTLDASVISESLKRAKQVSFEDCSDDADCKKNPAAASLAVDWTSKEVDGKKRDTLTHAATRKADGQAVTLEITRAPYDESELYGTLVITSKTAAYKDVAGKKLKMVCQSYNN